MPDRRKTKAASRDMREPAHADYVMFVMDEIAAVPDSAWRLLARDTWGDLRMPDDGSQPTETTLAERRATLPWLHIYAQGAWHSEASIEGTRRGLKNLREAIDRALASGMDAQSEAIVADGEGYEVLIKIRSFEALDRMPLPYTEPEARS